MLANGREEVLMADSPKQYGESRVQKGGNNGTPVHPKPTNLPPASPNSQQGSSQSSNGSRP